MLVNKIKMLTQENWYFILVFSFFFCISIYAFNGYFKWTKYFTDGNTIYSVAQVTNYESQGKSGRSISYSFYYNNNMFMSTDDQGDAVENSIYFGKAYETSFMQKLVIGKKYFVKFSVEKPKYCQIYLSMPVAEDFQYVEGQTWKTIPKGAIENKDIYGNDR
jgi:hypothetical protein